MDDAVLVSGSRRWAPEEPGRVVGAPVDGRAKDRGAGGAGKAASRARTRRNCASSAWHCAQVATWRSSAARSAALNSPSTKAESCSRWRSQSPECAESRESLGLPMNLPALYRPVPSYCRQDTVTLSHTEDAPRAVKVPAVCALDPPPSGMREAPAVRGRCAISRFPAASA